MRTNKSKKQTGVSLDIDVYQVLISNPHLNRSAWINDIVRQAMIEKGMLLA
jgi:hypothetical protein